MRGPHSRCGQFLQAECQGDPRPPEVSMAPWLEVVMPRDQEAAMFVQCQVLVTSHLEHWVVPPAGRDWLIINTQGTDWDTESCFLPLLPPLQAPARSHHSAFYNSAHSHIWWSCNIQWLHSITRGSETYWSNYCIKPTLDYLCFDIWQFPALPCWPDKCLPGSVQWREREDQCRTDNRGREPSLATRHWHQGKWHIASGARSVILFVYICWYCLYIHMSLITRIHIHKPLTKWQDTIDIESTFRWMVNLAPNKRSVSLSCPKILSTIQSNPMIRVDSN